MADKITISLAADLSALTADIVRAIAAVEAGAARMNGALSALSVNAANTLGGVTAAARAAEAMASNPPPAPKAGASDQKLLTQWRQKLALDKGQADITRLHDLEADKAYWQDKLRLVAAGSKEEIAVKLQVANISKQLTEQRYQDSVKAIEHERRNAQTAADEKQEQINFDRQMGEISGSEAIRQEQNLETTRYNINTRALEAKRGQWAEESRAYKDFNRQIEELEQQHQLRMKKLQDKEKIEAKQRWQQILQPISSAFSTSIKGVIQGTQTLKQAMAHMAQSIVLSFLDMGIKIATNWLASRLAMLFTTQATEGAQTTAVVTGETARTGAVVTGEGVRTGAKATGAAAGLAITAGSAIKEIAIDAYKAAAGAYSAIASIPYIGPFLAPVVAAGALAAVFKFGSSIASAEGGYDIPAGVNPVTQLHQNEMVLPAPLADRVRKMTAGGGGSGGGDTHLHVHAVDAKSVERLFRENGQALARVLKGQHRNFVGGMA